MTQHPDEEVIYMNKDAEKALRPFFLAPVTLSALYIPGFFTPDPVVMVYSAPGAGVKCGLLGMIVKEQPQLHAVFLKFPEKAFNPGMAKDLLAEIHRRRLDMRYKNAVILLSHCERAFRNTTEAGRRRSIEFFRQLCQEMGNREIEGQAVDGFHVLVTHFEMDPARLPVEVHAEIPVQVYFAPPGSAEREALFRSFFARILGHLGKYRTHFHLNVSDELYGQLADFSQSRSVREIYCFVKKVYRAIITQKFHSSEAAGARAASDVMLIDDSFILNHLENGDSLNKDNPDGFEDALRQYAGRPQSYHFAEQQRHAKRKNGQAGSFGNLFGAGPVTPESTSRGMQPPPPLPPGSWGGGGASKKMRPESQATAVIDGEAHKRKLSNDGATPSRPPTGEDDKSSSKRFRVDTLSDDEGNDDAEL